MVKELDKAGIPTAHMVNMLPVAEDVGSGRIVQTVAIPYPMGNPDMPEKDRFVLSCKLVDKALDTLADDISEQKIYR